MPGSPPLAGRRRALSREVFGWCAFDFANSSYTTLITTVAFSVYFREAVVGAGEASGDLLWSAAGIGVNLVLIATSPVLGAAADYSGKKKRLLLATVLQTVAATALLALAGPGRIGLALGLYIVASVGFEGGYIFYNAFLPEVSTPETIGKISALAWGLGFVGGLVSLVACAPFIGRPLTLPGGALDPASTAGYRISFVVVAVFFALFSIPTFLFLKESAPLGRTRRWTDYAVIGFRRVGETLRHLGRHREAAKYVLAYVCFFGGINTVIRFSAIYASRTFDIRGRELVALFIFTNLIAVPGTIAAGWLADRIGQRRALAITLLLWVAVVVDGAFARGKAAFWLMAAGAAIGMGSTQAVGRSLMAALSPPDRESEFFGFYVLAGQVGSIVAFLVFGLVSSRSGDQRSAVLWTVPFFVAGLLLTLWIREGRRAEGGS
jgi:UMF1 family MFS transporter